MSYSKNKRPKNKPKSQGKSANSWKNPVLEGKEYLKLYLSGDCPTYETIAKKFGITRARICQMITLARKLTDEIVAVFSDINYADKLQHITERKLRPITLMKTDREKIEAFNKLMRSDTNPC